MREGETRGSKISFPVTRDWQSRGRPSIFSRVNSDLDLHHEYEAESIHCRPSSPWTETLAGQTRSENQSSLASRDFRIFFASLLSLGAFGLDRPTRPGYIVSPLVRWKSVDSRLLDRW